MRRFRKHRRGVAALVLAMLAALASCGQDPRGIALQGVPGGDAQHGIQMIRKYGCGSCHVIPGVPGANGTVGAPLIEFSRRRFIAGALPNTPDNLVRWIQNPQGIEPGTAMPNLGVSETEARDIAAYLATLK